MTTRLPQPRQRCQHRHPLLRFSAFARMLENLAPPLFENRLIHRLLFRAHLAQDDLFDPGRQFRRDLGLRPSQHERSQPLTQPAQRRGVTSLRDRRFVTALKFFGRTEITRHQEIEDRPKVVERVFHRRAGEHESPRGP